MLNLKTFIRFILGRVSLGFYSTYAFAEYPTKSDLVLATTSGCRVRN